MNRIQYGNWVPGAVLSVFSQRHLVNHVGIAGPLDSSGRRTVYHASKDRGVFILTFYEEFAEGQEVSYTWLPQNLEEQTAVLNRAQGQVGGPFNLSVADCEDYVNWIVMGRAYSPQRNFVLLALGILGFFWGTRALRSA